MVVVMFICVGYLLLVFALLFFVKNEWCDLLFSNMTVRLATTMIRIREGRWETMIKLQHFLVTSYQENAECRPKSYNKVGVFNGTEFGHWKDLMLLNSNQRRQHWKRISIQESESLPQSQHH